MVAFARSSYCGGAGRFDNVDGLVSEKPRIEGGIAGCAAAAAGALSMDDGRRSGADDSTVISAAAGFGGAACLAYAGRCVFLASTRTSRNRLDSCSPCDTQSTSVA